MGALDGNIEGFEQGREAPGVAAEACRKGPVLLIVALSGGDARLGDEEARDPAAELGDGA